MTEKQGNNTYKSYDVEFKKDIVSMLDTTGRPIGKVANEVGVSANTLRNWKEKYSGLSSGNGKHSGNGAGDVIGEIVDLKRELAEVKEERDILKKVVAIISKTPKRG